GTLQGFSGQTDAVAIIGGAAQIVIAQLDTQTVLLTGYVQHLDCFGNDLRTDTIAGENQNLLAHIFSLEKADLLDGVEQPWLGLPMLLFEGANRIGVFQGQADIVQAVEQTVLAKLIDLEAVVLAIRPGNGLRLQINRQLISLFSLCLLEQLINIFFI